MGAHFLTGWVLWEGCANRSDNVGRSDAAVDDTPDGSVEMPLVDRVHGRVTRSPQGIAPSFAFVAEPQTVDIAEHFIRKLKEQAILGREFETVDEVRVAVGDFVARYNADWGVEKNGFLTPTDARSGFEVRQVA